MLPRHIIRLNHPLVEEELGACAVDLVPLEVHVAHLLELLLTVPILGVASEDGRSRHHHPSTIAIANRVLIHRWLLDRMLFLRLPAKEAVTLRQACICVAVVVAIFRGRCLALRGVKPAI